MTLRHGSRPRRHAQHTRRGEGKDCASNSQQTYLLNYDYDRFGNRYQHAAENPTNTNPLPYVPVEDGQISQTTNRFLSGLSYDDAGNVLVDSKFRGRKYEYDANGRQKWTALLDNTGAATSVYDGAGQRVATIADGTMSIMVYDATGKLVAEYGQSAGTANGTQYVFTDHQGSTRVVTNSSGEVVSRQDYQPFGEELGAVGMRSTDPHYGGANNARQKYAGMEKDDATGMSHTLWRKYDNISGRWTSPDPYGGSMTVSDPQSFNRYTYVNNDPVNLVDTLGLMAGGADQGWNSVANGFWGGGFDFASPPRPAGRQIFENGMNDFPDRAEEEESEEEDSATEETGEPGSEGQQDDRPYIGDMVDPNGGVGMMGGEYRFKISQNGMVGGEAGHDGDHVMGAENGSRVSAIKGLTGTVLTWYGQGRGQFTVYILLADKKTVMVLKDLENLSSTIRKAPFTNTKKQDFLDKKGNPTSKVKLKAGDYIGKTSKWVEPTNKSQTGLHFTFVKFQFIQQYRKDITKQTGSPANYFIAPCGSSSPVRCR